MIDFLDASEEESADFPNSGCTIRDTERGWRIVTLDYWAVPERRKPSWRATQERLMGKRKFAREYLRDWDSADGDVYYPEFNDLGIEHFVKPLTELPTGCTLWRGFDFGGRRPACVWGVYSFKQDRLWILREFITQRTGGFDILGTHGFRDLVLYLSGELPIDALDDRARYWADWYGANNYPETPWFSPGLQWQNFSGPECMTMQANAAKDPRDATAAAVFAAGGIELVYQAGRVKARHEIFRRFLRLRDDGLPGVLFDPACKEIIRAMSGAFTFAKETAGNPVPDRPRKDGHYDNLIDAMTYAVCALVPSDTMPLPRHAPIGQFLPRATAPDPTSLDLYELQPRFDPDARPWIEGPSQ